MQPGERLLDLGCGTGALLSQLSTPLAPAGRLSGVDLSPAMLAVARRRLPPTVHLAVGDAAALPFPDASFDLLVSSSSFHLWSRPERALAEVVRVLRPGARLVITDWCGDYLACRIFDHFLRWRDPGHRTVYGAAECRALLSGAGLSEVRIERYRSTWVWGMMTATARAAAGPGL